MAGLPNTAGPEYYEPDLHQPLVKREIQSISESVKNGEHDTKTPGVFMWGNKSCDDFEPRKTPADQPTQYFL